MPLKIMPVQEADERYKQARRSALETLDEWVELKTKLSAGLKRAEAVVVELPTSKIKNLRPTFKRRTRNYIKKLRLPYTVRAMKDSSGTEVVIVANESAQPVSTKKKR